MEDTKENEEKTKTDKLHLGPKNKIIQKTKFRWMASGLSAWGNSSGGWPGDHLT